MLRKRISVHCPIAIDVILQFLQRFYGRLVGGSAFLGTDFVVFRQVCLDAEDFAAHKPKLEVLVGEAREVFAVDVLPMPECENWEGCEVGEGEYRSRGFVFQNSLLFLVTSPDFLMGRPPGG